MKVLAACAIAWLVLGCALNRPAKPRPTKEEIAAADCGRKPTAYEELVRSELYSQLDRQYSRRKARATGYFSPPRLIGVKILGEPEKAWFRDGAWEEFCWRVRVEATVTRYDNKYRPALTGQDQLELYSVYMKHMSPGGLQALHVGFAGAKVAKGNLFSRPIHPW